MKKDLTPSYEQKTFADGEKRGRLRLVASRDGRDGSVRIHQDADLYASLLDKDEAVAHALSARRHAWIQVVRGAVDVNGKSLARRRRCGGERIAGTDGDRHGRRLGVSAVRPAVTAGSPPHDSGRGRMLRLLIAALSALAILLTIHVQDDTCVQNGARRS